MRVEKNKLYEELAPWWPLVSAPADYRDEAQFYARTLGESCRKPPRTLLELGCGGGNNASHLKARFDLTLVDASPGMLEVSRALNPHCEHVQGDMRHVRLRRRFDAVFVHDAIMYLVTAGDLQRALATAYEHCRDGGAALFAPDHVRESFRPSTDCGGHDGDRRSLRYLEWIWDPDPGDTAYTVDYAFLLREGRGAARVVEDRHTLGLFEREEWLRMIAAAGFAPRRIPSDYGGAEAGAGEVFVGIKSSE